jgi:hypothetical protein
VLDRWGRLGLHGVGEPDHIGGQHQDAKAR